MNAVGDTWDRHRLIEQISSSSSSSSSSGDVVKPECADAAECTIQPDLRCGKVECVNGKCELAIAIGAIASQLRGDCDRLDCDVQGQVVDVDDPSDIYNDGKQCSFDTCEQGTLAELAERSGLTAVYLCDIENGKRDPCFSAIERVAKGLDMSVAELFGQMPRHGLEAMSLRESARRRINR